jgi:hypothetical protein
LIEQLFPSHLPLKRSGQVHPPNGLFIVQKSLFCFETHLDTFFIFRSSKSACCSTSKKKPFNLLDYPFQPESSTLNFWKPKPSATAAHNVLVRILSSIEAGKNVDI